MKNLINIFGMSALFIVANAAISTILTTPTLIRAPHYDSAIVHSERFGPNFAYSTLEGHTYPAVAPILRSNLPPVELRYHVNALPLAIPTAAHHYYIQQPVLTHFTPGVELATDPVKNDDEKQTEHSPKNDVESISIESA